MGKVGVWGWFFVCLSLLVSAKSSAASWAFFKSDGDRDSFFQTSALGPSFQPLWTAPLTGAGVLQYSSPVTDGTKCYIASTGGAVYAINLTGTGAALWTFHTEGPIYASPGYALVDTTGEVFAGSTDRYLYALNANTGALIWKQQFPNAIFSSPLVITVNGIQEVLFGCNDGVIRGLRADTGALLWSYTTGNYVLASPAFDPTTHFVLCPSMDGLLYAVNLSGPTVGLAWTQNVGPTAATPMLDPSNVYSLSRQGTLSAWKIATGSAAFSAVVFPNERASSSPALGSVGLTMRVVAALEDGSVVATNYVSGSAPAAAWTAHLPGPVYSSPAISNGLVFVGASDGNLHMLNFNTGLPVGTGLVAVNNAAYPVAISPAIAGNLVLVGSSAGELEAFSTKPSPTVSPTATMTQTYTVTPTPSPTWTRTPSPSASPSETGTPTATPSPTATPTATAASTPSLSLQVTAVSQSANPGDTVTFRLILSNASGAGDASNLSLVDPVPDFSTFASASKDAVVPMSVSGPAVGGTGNVVWTIPDLAAGQSATVTLSVVASPSLAGSCGLFQENFDSYTLGSQITVANPAKWTSQAPTYYLVASDPTNASNQMAELQSIFSLLPPFGSRSPSVSQYFLSTVQSFSSSVLLQLDFVAPSSNMQDIVRMGDFSVTVDGGNLELQTEVWSSSIDYSYNTIASVGPGAWTLGGKMHLTLIYNGTHAITKAAILDLTLGKTVVQGKTCVGNQVSSYPLELWNQAVNTAPNGYLYVDNINMGRSITDGALLSGPNFTSLMDCDGVAINCSIGFTPTPAPTAGATPMLVAKSKSIKEKDWLPEGKNLVAVPNPASDRMTIGYRLDSPATVRLALMNLNGETVKLLNLGMQPTGTGESVLSLSEVASGLYFVVLETDAGGGYKEVGIFKSAVLK